MLAICLGYATVCLLRTRQRATEAYELVFGILGAVALLASLCLVDQKFDRYLLPAIPWMAFSAALALPAQGAGAAVLRWSIIFSGAFLVAMAAYSIVNQHNHMAEKRVWVTAINDLVDQGVPRETIDATWIFNGADLYDRFGSDQGRGWYRSRTYAVTTWPMNGWTLLRRYTVPRWPIWGATGPDVLVHGPKSAEEP